MHKRKDEIRDIYQGQAPDFEKDFTPQVAKEILEERQRDIRKGHILSLFFGGLVLILSVALAVVVIRDFLSTRNIADDTLAEGSTYIPRYTLPQDATWVMEYQNVASELDDGTPGPKPLSTKWVKNAAYHIIMGQQALAVGSHESALDHFALVVEMYPEMEGLHRVMGSLHLQREKFAEAAKHLERAREDTEENFDVLNNLGTAYIGTKEYESAEKHLLHAQELQPENPRCHKNLAVLYRKMERDNDAVFHFEKYIDLRPNDLDTMQTYALYLTKLGRWEKAAAFLTSLTEEVTNVAPVYFLLAQVQVQNGKEDAAISALQRGIQLIDPDLALAWMSRKEFNEVRNTRKFKGLVDELEIAQVSLTEAP